MTRKFLQLAMMAAGLALAAGSATACADDSTATAPITSNPVTTTAMYSSPSSSSAPTPEEESDPTAQMSTPREPAEEAGPEGGNAALPATEPERDTEVPEDFPGPGGQEVSEKGRNYLRALEAEDVTFMGDTDNNIALTMAEYICSEQRKGTDPVTVKAYVTASVGPGTDTVAEANAKADKVIRAAHENYC